MLILPLSLHGVVFLYAQEQQCDQFTVRFIKECTNAVIVVAELEAWITMACIRTNSIGAGAIVAYVGMTFALIYVKAGISSRCQLVAIVTNTLEAPLEVVALSIAADSRSFCTLINIC
jgi:hypothetical protein